MFSLRFSPKRDKQIAYQVFRSLFVSKNTRKRTISSSSTVFNVDQHSSENSTILKSSMSSAFYKQQPLPSLSDVEKIIEECHKPLPNEKQKEQKQTPTTHPIEYMPIRAVHLARRVNILQLFQRLYTDRYKVSHYLHKDSIVLKLSGKKRTKPIVLEPKLKSEEGKVFPDVSDGLNSIPSSDKWVVYFDYGAVVFFNCEESLASTLIRHAKRFATDSFDMRGHDEELMLQVDPNLKSWSNLSENIISIKRIDNTNIQIIAGVLAQTVALEYYERQVESILVEFERLNSTVSLHGPRGTFFNFLMKQSEKQQNKKLFHIVATNNTLLIDLVSKLRVIDRKRPGDAAWDQAKYHMMWETLLEDFEVNERFENLNFKLELIQHNTQFFLEVLGSHRGERLEWYIIILISLELGISVFELLS